MWTIPNMLTVARVLATPLIAVIFVVLDGPSAWWAAFVVFTVAALTDFLDGWLARKLNQVSAFGRMLDPIADKAMVAVAGAVLTALYGVDPLVLIPVALILLREVCVSGLREFLKGAPIMDVTLLAKWKTTAQLVAIGALFLAGALGSALVETAGLALLWIAAGLTIVTGWDYFRRGLAYIQAQEDAS